MPPGVRLRPVTLTAVTKHALYAVSGRGALRACVSPATSHVGSATSAPEALSALAFLQRQVTLALLQAHPEEAKEMGETSHIGSVSGATAPLAAAPPAA